MLVSLVDAVQRVRMCEELYGRAAQLMEVESAYTIIRFDQFDKHTFLIKGTKYTRCNHSFFDGYQPVLRGGSGTA